MPQYDFTCTDCEHKFLALIKHEEIPDTCCPQCGSGRLQLGFNAISTYSIGGDNSASTRPKGA